MSNLLKKICSPSTVLVFDCILYRVRTYVSPGLYVWVGSVGPKVFIHTVYTVQYSTYSTYIQYVETHHRH